MIKLAIDLGSSMTKIYRADTNSGIVLAEPSCVAVSGESEEDVRAIGKEAKGLIGKTAKYTNIISPIYEGKIANLHLAVVMLKEFFKDVKVTDSEVQLQMEMIKSQVGEDSWPLYLAYYGGGSEDSFKAMLTDSLRQESYISTKMESITIEDSIIEETYNADPNAHNIAVLDVVFFDSVEDLNKAKDMQKNGKTLKEIADEFGYDVFENEHTYYYSEGLTWSANFANCSVGDYIFSAEDSSSLVIGQIVELNSGVNNEKVREDLVQNLKYDEAYNITNQEYEEFLKTQTVKIFGEDFKLVEDTSASITDYEG